VFTEPLPRNGLNDHVVILLVHVLLRNGCFCGSTVPAWGKYAAIFLHKNIRKLILYLTLINIVEVYWPTENDNPSCVLRPL
jgi:hypothetical protein